MARAGSAKHRDRLVANGLAHKIRNSLNTMRAHIALAQKFTTLSSEQHLPRQIDKLEEAVVGLEEVIKEFLAFASPAQDEWQEVDLASVAREVLDFVGLDLEQGGVCVVEEFTAHLPQVYVDRAKLKRAILNLVVNARQAMPEGGRLVVRAKPAKGHIVMEVSDTGAGIPPEEQPRVFEPFFTTKPDGLGLGLPVVKRTIEDFGGRTSFESRPGQGTTFQILLPSAARQRAALERHAGRQQWLDPVS
jgi:two-component system sensor histidine kinase HydH